MRPMKRVLVVCGEAERRGVLSLVLRTRGYQVEQADGLGQAEAALGRGRGFDVALVLDSGERDHGERVVEALGRRARETRVLLQYARPLTTITQASRVLAPGLPVMQIVEAVRVAAARRRGPAPQRPVLPARTVEVVAGVAVA